MTKITKTFPEKGNAYILFGFEAIQARPNLDPYTSALRMNDETRQTFLSDVHIKTMSVVASRQRLPPAVFPMLSRQSSTKRRMKMVIAAISRSVLSRSGRHLKSKRGISTMPLRTRLTFPSSDMSMPLRRRISM